MKDFVLSYVIDNKLYLNITNRCTCNCTFCIRNTKDGVGYNLWLEREPDIDEVIGSLGDLSLYKEVVFCGYGEPLIRLDLVKHVAAHIKKLSNLPIRVNTNGHADIIHGSGSILQLKGLVDRISISLNAQNNEVYREICLPKLGNESYQAVIDFIKSCIGIIPEITLSVVKWPGVDVDKCREIAEELGVKYRVRSFNV